MRQFVKDRRHVLCRPYNKPKKPAWRLVFLAPGGGDRRNQEKIIATGEIIAKENRLIRSVSMIGLRLHLIVVIAFPLVSGRCALLFCHELVSSETVFPAKVGEWCVSRYMIFPKCRIPDP